MRLSTTALAAGAALGGALLLTPTAAEACGCFANPDPTVPLVQAGERLVFAHEDGQITAHIQIQYEGEGSEFGWLLPLPSVPDPLEIGSEELFVTMINATQPRYRLNRVTPETCDFQFGGRGGVVLDSSNAPPPEAGGDDLVVIQDSVGPYDYAVLNARSRDEMFQWLADNRYFVAANSEEVIDQYIYEGAYFLALKLRKGNDAGDIQPVVVRYEADYAMIPIVLTSVAANPDMGIQVWVLGEHRAIPRNYRHTILNDEHIDWFNAGQNYNDVIIAATNEAEAGQSFVTEYAGTTDPVQNVLDFDGRFGDRGVLERTTDPLEYLQYLRQTGFLFGPQLSTVLRRHFEMPSELAQQGVTEDDFFDFIDSYLWTYRDRFPDQYAAIELDAVELTADLWERIVTPTLAAGALLKKFPKMTRLYTTLSPDEMTRDPVFSFNPSLPDVSNTHEATFTYLCDAAQDGPNNTPGILTLPDGRRFYLENQSVWTEKDRSGVPYSRRIEMLREEGPPEIEIDNSANLSTSDAAGDKGCACSTEPGPRGDLGLANLLAALAAVGLIAFRRRIARPTR